MKQERGITLIALVITIIVLLILAGISIAMLTGDNGLFTKTKNAAAESKIAEAKEHVMLTVNELIADFYDKKYVQNETLGEDESTAEKYVAKHLGDAGKLDAKYASYASGIITLVEKDPTDGTTAITGTYDSTSTDENLGTITWTYPAANSDS